MSVDVHRVGRQSARPVDQIERIEVRDAAFFPVFLNHLDMLSVAAMIDEHQGYTARIAGHVDESKNVVTCPLERQVVDSLVVVSKFPAVDVDLLQACVEQCSSSALIEQRGVRRHPTVKPCVAYLTHILRRVLVQSASPRPQRSTRIAAPVRSSATAANSTTRSSDLLNT